MLRFDRNCPITTNPCPTHYQMTHASVQPRRKRPVPSASKIHLQRKTDLYLHQLLGSHHPRNVGVSSATARCLSSAIQQARRNETRSERAGHGTKSVQNISSTRLRRRSMTSKQNWPTRGLPGARRSWVRTARGSLWNRPSRGRGTNWRLSETVGRRPSRSAMTPLRPARKPRSGCGRCSRPPECPEGVPGGAEAHPPSNRPGRHRYGSGRNAQGLHNRSVDDQEAEDDHAGDKALDGEAGASACGVRPANPISQRRKSWNGRGQDGASSSHSETPGRHPSLAFGPEKLSTQQPEPRVRDIFRTGCQGTALCRSGSKLPSHRRHRMQRIS
jgi:hypothetical protein